MKNFITLENWTYARFQGPELLAMINLGAELDASGSPRDLYLLTLTDLDYREVTQMTYHDLDEALAQLNKKYSHWDLNLNGAPREGDGCSSCHAH